MEVIMLKDFTKMKFDIMIVAGQSNCEGAGLGDVEFPYEPKGNIWMLNQDFTISQAMERIEKNQLRGRFPLHFADEYVADGQLDQNRDLLILQAAVGATGFQNHKWGRGEVLSVQMHEMIRTAVELNRENRIVAFLWHQGEREVNFLTPADVHYENMNRLLSDLRGEFGYDFPMIAGDFVPDWKLEKSKVAEVIAEKNKQIFELFGGGFVETTGLTSNYREVPGNQEKIHFSRKAMQELGKRYYQVYKICK